MHLPASATVLFMTAQNWNEPTEVPGLMFCTSPCGAPKNLEDRDGLIGGRTVCPRRCAPP